MSTMSFAHPERLILVVTALSEERKSIIPFLKQDSIKTKSDKYSREYIVGDFFYGDDARPWHILLPAPSSAGNAKSAAETAFSLALDPAFIFLLGVAGGFPNKVNMYDVVVADRVYDADAAKIDEEGNYISRPDQHKATSVLLSRAKTLQDLGGWQVLLHPDLPNENIEVWIEPIAAGSKLVASSKSEEFKRVKQNAPRAVAVENEGFGVMQAAHEAAVAALVIRGISDLIDNRPPDEPSEAGTRVGPDRHKLKAARHAAAFMFALISRLSAGEIEEAANEENEWVDVRLRWEDLRELAKGKRLTLQIFEGSPVRSITSKIGSVEVQIKTDRLISAFIYAISLEKPLFERMIELVPDQVETTIDTSDPTVARIFSVVRKLASNAETERRQGERELKRLVTLHSSLKAFAEKAVKASRMGADSATPSVDSDKKGRVRVSFSIDQGSYNYLSDLSKSNYTTIGALSSTLLELAIKDVKSVDANIDSYGVHSSNATRKISTYLSKSVAAEIDLFCLQHEIHRSKLFGALIGYSFEMRLLDAQELRRQPADSLVALDVEYVDTILQKANLSRAALARRAGVSRVTIYRALNGGRIRRSTAQKLLDLLSSALGKRLPEGLFLNAP